ncbi:MAG TPA: hypothetical protein VGM01_11105, partial [Ktedonobacteraceae bacterium]
MPRMSAGDQYFTAGEVMKELRMTQGEFNTLVRNGALKPFTPPGKKQSVYKRADVKQIARERELFASMPQKTSSIFGRATREDIKATVEITRVLFGLRDSAEATFARRLAWWDRNQELFYVLKTEEQIVGYAVML